MRKALKHIFNIEQTRLLKLPIYFLLWKPDEWSISACCLLTPSPADLTDHTSPVIGCPSFPSSAVTAQTGLAQKRVWFCRKHNVSRSKGRPKFQRQLCKQGARRITCTGAWLTALIYASTAPSVSAWFCWFSQHAIKERQHQTTSKNKPI